MPVTPYPSDLFAAGRRHLFVFAHQDDDLPQSGVLHRLHQQAEIVWVTNGDGLAPMAGMEREQYAALRTQEAIAATALLGYRRGQLEFLGHSELDIYQLLIDLARQPQEGERVFRPLTPGLVARINRLAAAVIDRLVPRVEKADVVWTLAWQGGHVEHDLSHFFTARAVAEVAKRQGRAIPFFEFPEYELTYLVPLRFRPWHQGVRHRCRLTPDELRLKEAAFAAYKSQAEGLEQFRRLIRLLGTLSALRGRPFSFRDYVSEEEFGPVPADRDYTRAPHGHPFFDYMFEDYKHVRITFPNSISRIVAVVQSGAGR